MYDNSTFNTDIYEKAVVSFKNDRRVLVKYGKVSKFKITRYYILQNEFLLYYKNSKCQKSQSSFSLSGCQYIKESSKIKKLNYSIKVITADLKKIFWLHPKSNDEISLLEKYIKFVSEGRFNNDQVIQQLFNDQNNLSNKEKCTSAFSSHLQIGFNTNCTPIVNRGSQNSNQEPALIGFKDFNELNKIQNAQQQQEESESEYTTYQLANIHKNQKGQTPQQELQNFEQSCFEEIQKLDQLSKLNKLSNQNDQNDSIKNQQQIFGTQNSPEKTEKQRNFQQQYQIQSEQINQQISDSNRQLHLNKEEQNIDLDQNKKKFESIQFTNKNGGLISGYQSQQNNEYLITLGQLSQNNMFTNQNNISYENKYNSSIDKFNASNMSQIFKNMDNNLSQQGTNYIQEGHNIPSNFPNFQIGVINSKNNQDFDANDEKDLSAIFKTANQSPYLDIEADLKFSSDEEFSNNKNEKLESMRMQFQLHSPCANKGYNFGATQNQFKQELQTKSNNLLKVQLFQDNKNYGNEQDIQYGFGGYYRTSNKSINSPSANMIYGVHPISSTNNTSNIISPQVKINNQLQSQQQYSNSYKQFQLQQQDNKDKNVLQSGPCNFSSSTLQNIFFPESQKNFTESPQGSFFSNKQGANINFFETNNNTQYNNKGLGFQLSQNQQKRNQQKRDKNNLNNIQDLGDKENISSEDEEQFPSSHINIKQQVFYAGASRTFIEDVFSIRSNDIQQQQTQKNHIGVISNYSFDRKSMSDTDLFDQEDLSIQKSATEILRDEEDETKQNKNKLSKRGSEKLSSQKITKNQYKKQIPKQYQKEIQNIKITSNYNQLEVPQKNQNEKVNLRYAEEDNKSQNNKNSENEDQENCNDLDEDEDLSNPAIANNVTYIIERYKEQNLNEMNSSFFNSQSNQVKKNDLNSINQNAKAYSQKNGISPLGQVNQNTENRSNFHMSSKSLGGFRQNASQTKRSLSNLEIDTDKCNVQYKENDREIPQIKDKKEFYNKKNIINFIVPKMEETLDYLKNDNMSNKSKQISVEQCYIDGYHYLWSFQFQNTHDIFKIYREENINFEYALLEHNLLQIIVTGNKELIATTETKYSEFLEYLLACQKDVQKKGEKSSIKCLRNISKMAIDLIKSEVYLVKGLLQAFLNNKFQSFISFKNAYSQFQKVKQQIESSITKQQTFDDYLQKEQDKYTQSRYYFIAGIFNIGLAMIPNYFLKILSLIGIQPNKQLGYECLEKCIELQSIRSSYASLLLCIEYIELNPNLEKSIVLIKKMIKKLPQCPLFYWMASLLSWRYAKPDDALNLINKSLWNCGEKLGDIAFYLKFEKGWYNVSQFDWKQAQILFEDIAIMAIDTDNFDMDCLNSIAQQKKIPPRIPQLITNFIEKAKGKQKYKLILPHKCCLAALIACCYENEGMQDHMDLWLLMTSYLIKKHSDGKTAVDEDISKVCSKYINRTNKQFIKYEILYFVKEITKLRDDMLNRMVDEINFYYESEYSSISDIFYKNILKNNPQKSIDFGSIIFLRIVAGCLLQNLQVVYESGKVLDKIAEYIPSDHFYILHHSYHWLARCQIQQNLYSNAKENIKKCLKYKKCEFTLENKSQKLLQEISFAN